MNLRSLAGLLGWKSPPRTYGCDVVAFDLPREGRVELARWRHPQESPKVIRQDTIDELRTFLRPGDVAIDIGAHTGDTTIPMALAVGPTGLVLALEPNPYVYPVLEKNAALNSAKATIVPLPFAATAAAGPVEFEYSDSGFCNGGRHEGVSRWRHAHPYRLTVRGERLESYLNTHHPDVLDRIRFIKVDAEGYDLAVLESIAGLVDRARPFIRVEVHRLMSSPRRQRLLAFLLDRRYRVWAVESDVRYRWRRVDSRVSPAGGQFDLFAEPAVERPL